MSFESLSKYKYARASNDHDTIAVQKKDIVIRLGDETLAAMGWKEGDKIDVQRGTGEQHGMVRLAKNPAGWKLYYPTAKKRDHKCSGLVLKLGKKINGPTFPQMPDHAPATTIIPSFHGDQITFRLPWMPVRNAEQAIANGFPVRRIPTPPPADVGNPVRGKAGQFSGGRVG